MAALRSAFHSWGPLAHHGTGLCHWWCSPWWRLRENRIATTTLQSSWVSWSKVDRQVTEVVLAILNHWIQELTQDKHIPHQADLEVLTSQLITAKHRMVFGWSKHSWRQNLTWNKYKKRPRKVNSWPAPKKHCGGVESVWKLLKQYDRGHGITKPNFRTMHYCKGNFYNN